MGDLDRFWRHVSLSEDSGGCFELDTSTNGKGYPNIYFQGKVTRSNRAAWMIFYGEIPRGMHVLHHCDNRKCVRPDHLFLGTNHDNCLDAASKGRNKRGEENHFAKLKLSDVERIRAEYANGRKSRKELANEYGVAYTNVCAIVTGRSWVSPRP